MYEQLKNDMREAGIPVSEGNDLAQSDLQLVRDYFYFAGITLYGDDFLAYASSNGADESLDQEGESSLGAENTETDGDQGFSSDIEDIEDSVPEVPVTEETVESSVAAPEISAEDANVDAAEQADDNENNEGTE